MQSEKEYGVSIIVPVYNGEAYLNRCLDSIYKQDYCRMELILVDDGSTDETGRICDEYEKRFTDCIPTKVLHKSNEGLMEARRDGVKAALYDYIAFVDADDWIEQNHIRLMMEEIVREQADCIIEGVSIEQRGRTRRVYNRFENGVYESAKIQNEIYPQMLYYDGFFSFGIQPYMWNKVFKKTLLEKCYNAIDTRIYDGEDVLTFFSYMLFVNKIIIGDKHTYHYCMTGSSMTAQRKKDYLTNISRLYLSLANMFMQVDQSDILMEQLNCYLRMMTLRSAPEHFIEAQKNMFPFTRVQVNSDIIVYGAGLVGKTYVYQVQKSGYCNIVAWIDKNYKIYDTYMEISVSALEQMKKVSYDFLVIAVEDPIVVDEICKELVENYSVDPKKIVKGE